MYCLKCGSEINPTQLFCTKCGARVEVGGVSDQNPESVSNSRIQNDTQSSDDGCQTGAVKGNAGQDVDSIQTPKNNTDSPSLETSAYDSVKTKKSKSKLTKRLLKIFIPIVLVLSIGIGAFAHPVLRNSILRTFMSDRQYFKYVMGKSIKNGVSDLSSDLKLVQNAISGKNSMLMGLELEIGDGGWNLIDETAGERVSSFLNWFKSVGVSLDIGRNANTYGGGIDFKVNGKELADVNYVMKDDSMYISVPDLNNTAVRISDKNMSDELNAVEYSKALDTLSALFPNEKTITDIISRYSLCIVDNISNIDEKDFALTAGSVTQKAIGMTATIDEKTAVNIAKAFLGEAQNDKDIKNIIKNACDSGICSGDFENIYSEYTQAISEAYKELETVETGSESEKIPVRFIANNRGEVIGMDIIYNGSGFKYYNTQSGENRGQLISFDTPEGTVLFEGSGKVKNGKYTGTHTLSVMGIDVLNINLENVDEKLYDKGIFNGSAKITAGEAVQTFAGQSGVNKDVVSLIADMEIVITSSAKQTGAGNWDIGVNSKSENIVNLKINYDMTGKPDYTIPESYIESDSEKQMSDWFEQCGENLVDRLGDVGVPDYLMYFLNK